MSPAVSLPIDQYLPEIVDKILQPTAVILSASPGSGKTTRVPAALLKKLRAEKSPQKIIVLVPKRISALSAASRIAEENQWTLGADVGYVVRFESMVNETTQLIFMTDGVFLKKSADPDFIKSLGYVFLDEFHERKSNMDLILGFLFEQKILYNNIQIIVMSATLSTNQLQKYFGTSHTIEVQAPPYELKKIYLNTNQKLVCDAAFYEQLKNTALEAWRISAKDILIFLPGLREINKALEILKPRFPQVPLEILHGSLSLAAQKNIVSKSHNQRRIVLATNIAESSLTLTGLDCVIDSGLEKNVLTEKKIGFSRLKTDRISVFSATQREGRAARTQNGFCFKLWHPVDERSMRQDIEPEVLSSPLHNELLLLAAFGVSDFLSFSWLNAPSNRQILAAKDDLMRWGLISSEGLIQPLGRLVASSPVNIINSILLIELLCFIPSESEKLCDLVARLDQLESSDNSAPRSHYTNDLERILDTPLNTTQSRLKNTLKSFSQQIQKLVKENKMASPLDFETQDSLSVAIFRILAHYFPQRVIAKKNGIQGLSSTGRGVEATPDSTLSNFDFYVALYGEEKNDAITLIKYGIGISKAEALKILGHEARTVHHIFYDENAETFFQQETLFYGSFKLNEKSKERVSATELKKTWKKFALENPSAFLDLNSSYLRLKILIHFLQIKQDQCELKPVDFYFMDTFESELIKKVSSLIDDFEEFKITDLTHYLDALLPEKVRELILQLPQDIKLPSGRTVSIDYTDPKAPLLSSKLQDFFGWSTTPLLLGKIPFTTELLAPNMRPTQITNDLQYFWKNSYLDVRKDLKARYPKHSWPEDPTET